MLERKNNDLLVREIDLLRATVRAVRNRYPFEHEDYLDVKPVKHGLVEHVIDWPNSSFRRYVVSDKLGR
ncbi:hypothetical protein [Methylomonas sp. CM2]|uniref:hypothetical protein n=1 Tax=Methylomonas sp. CM2 TaxID=3417647 RepID=UPI003CF2E780